MVMRHVKGEVEEIVADRVPLEVDGIFDSGLFDEERQVILVEGGPGSGKTSLTYHYGQKWAAGNLSMFNIVALVHLRDLAVTPAGTLHGLLLLACSSGSDDIITKEMIQQYVMKSPKLLLILDGWDEAPNEFRKPSFVNKILQHVPPKAKILITSRPDSSVNLHGTANRIEIVGFTEVNIHEYFRKALATELDHGKVQDGCRKLKEHFLKYPVIQSCCSIPLNAAILAHLFLTDQSLPSTRHELFLVLVLSCINRELQKRYSQEDMTVFSLDDLPHEHKIVLDHICVLAFEGVKQNKVIFPKEELVRLKLPRDLPALGVLQIVESFGKLGKTAYRYFIHLSIQELLAAYHISKLGENEQVQVFQDLFNEPRFSAVLQSYAAFTRLANQGVQSIITGRSITHGSEYSKESKLTLLTLIRCFFEAQICDQLLCQQIISRLNGKLDLSSITLTPADCMSVGYFLAIVLKVCVELSVHLKYCSIDDYSFGLLMEELSRHAEARSTGVLQGVTELDITNNQIKDSGIARISSLLLANTTMKKLTMYSCGISDMGAQSLAGAVAKNVSLEVLNLPKHPIVADGIACIATALLSNTTLKSIIIGGESTTDEAAESLAKTLTGNTSMKQMMLIWSSTRPDNALKNMTASASSSLRTLALHMHVPARLSVKEQKEWHQHLEIGGKELMKSMEDSHIEMIWLKIIAPRECETVERIKSQTETSLKVVAASVNSIRGGKKLPSINFRYTI